MKSGAILLFALMFTAYDIFAQTLSKKPSRNEVGSYNQAHLLKVDIGVTKTKVLEAMGGVQKIQTYTSTSFMTKKEGIIINLSLIHISEPTRLLSISYAVFCLKKK